MIVGLLAASMASTAGQSLGFSMIMAGVIIRAMAMIRQRHLRSAPTFAKIPTMNPGSLRPCDRHDGDEQQHLAQ